ESPLRGGRRRGGNRGRRTGSDHPHQPRGLVDCAARVLRGRRAHGPLAARAPGTGCLVTRPAILVLNAGSSSVKFLLFAEQGNDLAPQIRGQIEAIHTSPHFIARTPQGMVAEKYWGGGVTLGHAGAVAHLAEFLRGYANGFELEAVGHRVVHGGPDYVRPVALDRAVLAALEKLVPLAPLHQPHNLAPIRTLFER